MNSRHKQRGMGFWGWFFVLPMIGIIGFIGVKLSTSYMNYATIKSAIDNVAHRDRLHKPSHGEIRREIQKLLLVNEVRFLKPEDIKIKKMKDGTHVFVDYTQTVPMAANIDALMKFKHDSRLKNINSSN